MTFYGLKYLSNTTGLIDYLKYGLLFGSLILLIFVFTLYMRHRLNTKYRDLSLIFLLTLLFSLGVQYSDYQNDLSNFSASSQMVGFMKKMASDYGVSTDQVYVSNTHLQDQMLVKIEDNFYRLSLSNDSSNYQLTMAYPVNSQINYQD